MVTFLLSVAALSSAAAANGSVGEPFLLSIPASIGEPRKANADVAFISDGFALRGCKVIRSSGDTIADAQACKTLTYKLASKPSKGTAPVWISAPVPASYIPAGLASNAPLVGPDDYPSQSIKLAEQGTVIVRIDIGADATIMRCEVVDSSGFQRLDDAARRSICRRLKPTAATLDGVPVASINLARATFYIGE
jgi:TonB family protein